MSDTTQTRVLIDRRKVEAMVGLSYMSIFRRIKAGTFPQPVRRTATRIAWFLDEVEAYQKSLERGQADAPNLTKK